MRVLISGASGLVGTALSRALSRDGHTIARLVRPGGGTAEGDVRWDPASGMIDSAALQAVDAVINLAGASIAGRRWTAASKAVLRGSRIDSTRLLVDAIARIPRRPRVLVSASATGYYGDRGDEVLTEASKPGSDFLALLVRDWETEAMRARAAGIRTVMLRFGIILDSKGGALPKMLLPFRIGVGGQMGPGRQWMPWIALADAVQVARAALLDERFEGAFNTVAPNPVRNSEFTRIAAKVLHRPAIFAVPGVALRVMLGEMAKPLLLASARVVPDALTKIRCPFRFPELEPALHEMLRLR
ncbi:MAG: TIGR01777 family oxidoreductase [Acidobacteriota bacterium]|nr:TIGR01777 family oxidoreductase [Acidobacteriota bacterium]